MSEKTFDFTDDAVLAYGELYKEEYSRLWLEDERQAEGHSDVYLMGAACLNVVQTVLEHIGAILDEETSDEDQ